MDTDLENSILVDVGRLLGVSGQWAAGADRQLNSQLVLQQLLDAGWPKELAIFEYRPNTKSRVRFDIALFDEQRQLIAAVEVTRAKRLQGTAHAAMAERFFDHTSVSHVIVTDGTDYHLFGKYGTSQILSTVPSPSQLGIAIADSRRKQKPTILYPKENEALQSIMDEHSPSNVIIDFTLPWGDRLNQEHSLRELVSPNCLNTARGPIGSMHLMLAWAVSHDHVNTLSTMVPPATLCSSHISWLRKYLNQYIELATHIKLPQGTFAPKTFCETSLLRFQKGQSKSYFDSLTSVGDLIDIEAKQWFHSFSDWLAGAKPSQGFTRPVAELKSWEVSKNDPQAEAVRRRLEKMGRSSTLDELVEVRIGKRVDKDDRTNAQQEGEVRYITPQCLKSGASIYDSSEDSFITRGVSLDKEDYLCDGDILLSRLLKPSSQAIVFTENFPAVAGNFVIVLRPRENTSSLLIAEFLNSRAGRTLLETIATGSQLQTICTNSLRQIPVPGINSNTASDSFNDINDACENITAAANGKRPIGC